MKIRIRRITKLLQLSCIMLRIGFIHLAAVIYQTVGFIFITHVNTSV